MADSATSHVGCAPPDVQNDAERTALTELRAKLATVGDVLTPETSLWGVKLMDESDVRSSRVLIKFLRARELVVDDALGMLTDTLKWRAEINIDALIKEEFDPEFAKAGYLGDADKDGNPVSYNFYGSRLDSSIVFGDIEKFIRWRIQLMERAMERIDFDKTHYMTQVHDYEGVGVLSFDKRMKACAKRVIELFKAHYPEVLSRKMFIHMPAFFAGIYAIMRPFVPDRTKQKFIMTSGNPWKTLTTYIDHEHLPDAYV